MKFNKQLSLIVGALTILLLASCTQGHNTVEVKVPVKSPDAINFLEYDKVFYSGINIQADVDPVNPEEALTQFFTDEFEQIIEREITPIQTRKEGEKPARSIEERLKNLPKSLLIKGEFSIDIKTQSIVKDEKGESKKKVRVLSKVELWVMKLSVTFIETETWTPIVTHSLTTRLKDADPEKRPFNFKSLFDNITDQFVRKATRTMKMEKRTLLL